MDLLKKYVPYAFLEKKDLATLIIHVVVMFVIAIVCGAAIGLLASVPVLGIIFGLVGGLFDLYVILTIVLCFLDYFKILK